MDITYQRIFDHVSEAYKEVLNSSDPAGLEDGPKHRHRSQTFVKFVARKCRDDSGTVEGRIVFSGDCDLHRQEFDLNEFLFDIHVCDTDMVRSAGGHDLRYVKNSVVQMEVEFGDNRKAIVDFSKLVTGSAGMKVFVGSLTSRPEKTRKALLPVAKAAAAGGSGVVAIFLPRPSEWPVGEGEDRLRIEGYFLEASHWKRIEGSGDGDV